VVEAVRAAFEQVAVSEELRDMVSDGAIDLTQMSVFCCGKHS
jgi:hypothetical protein